MLKKIHLGNCFQIINFKWYNIAIETVEKTIICQLRNRCMYN